MSARSIADAVRSGRPRAEAKSLALNFVSAAAAGQPVVYGDANLLRQLFTNLIDNAIKFTDRGHVDVRLASHNGKAEVDVVDVSSGAVSLKQKITIEPEYQVPFARRIRAETGVTTAAVGSVTFISAPTAALSTTTTDAVLAAGPVG